MKLYTIHKSMFDNGPLKVSFVEVKESPKQFKVLKSADAFGYAKVIGKRHDGKPPQGVYTSLFECLKEEVLLREERIRKLKADIATIERELLEIGEGPPCMEAV